MFALGCGSPTKKTETQTDNRICCGTYLQRVACQDPRRDVCQLHTKPRHPRKVSDERDGDVALDESNDEELNLHYFMLNRKHACTARTRCEHSHHGEHTATTTSVCIKHQLALRALVIHPDV